MHGDPRLDVPAAGEWLTSSDFRRSGCMFATWGTTYWGLGALCTAHELHFTKMIELAFENRGELAHVGMVNRCRVELVGQ